MKNIKMILLCGMISMVTGFKTVQKNHVVDQKQITALANTPVIPVMKGVPANKSLQVIISIPAGNEIQHYRKLSCTINKTALPEIEKVDVYLTAAEPFSTNNLMASIQPSSSSFQIPVTLDLNPGVHFIWFSVVLKNNASINKKIEFNCTNLLSDKGRPVIVKNNNSVPQRTGIAIRKAWDDSVHSYRIPGIVQTEKGTLIAVYDIRYKNSGDLPGNIDVGMSRSTDSGRTWQPMKVIMDMGIPHENNGIGDPAILFDPTTKKIWVAALWSKGSRSIAGSLPGLSPDTTGQFVLVSSDDDGLTWSMPYTITPMIKNPVWHLFFNGPGSGIMMQNGKLVFAAQYWNEKKVPYSTIIYSDDRGVTWQGNINGPKSNTTESQVVETTPGMLMLNMRDNRGQFRSVAVTGDMGSSWTEHQTSYNALRDPVCMGSIIKVKVNVKGIMRDVLFFSNPNTSSGRYNITIKASLDLGETWIPAHQLLIDERLCYGYSALTKVDNHTIGILYEGIRDLYFVKVPVNEIIR